MEKWEDFSEQPTREELNPLMPMDDLFWWRERYRRRRQLQEAGKLNWESL